jgi:hypothetical protein
MITSLTKCEEVIIDTISTNTEYVSIEQNMQDQTYRVCSLTPQ